jgi:Na+/H+ antiporter NhaA
MSLLRTYITILPLPAIFSTVIGINIGCNTNKWNSIENSINQYSNVIGYTSLGILTGITYPISYPLFGAYVLYKNSKS